MQQALQQAGLPVLVELVDEMGTSKEAAQRLAQMGLRKGKRQSSIDAEAACLLVEAYLQGRGEPP